MSVRQSTVCHIPFFSSRFFNSKPFNTQRKKTLNSSSQKKLASFLFIDAWPNAIIKYKDTLLPPPATKDVKNFNLGQTYGGGISFFLVTLFEPHI